MDRSPVRIVRAGDGRAMAWKNGGGTTTEIATGSDGHHGQDRGEGYLWRLSLADVARDGPFSRFPRFDRISMMISGNGLVLEAGAHGQISLETAFAPASYSGDWPVHGTLTDGPIVNFNVIFNRRKLTADLTVLDPAQQRHLDTGPALATTVTLLRGDPLAVDDGRHIWRLEKGDTLVADPYSGHLGFDGTTGPIRTGLAAVVVFCPTVDGGG